MMGKEEEKEGRCNLTGYFETINIEVVLRHRNSIQQHFY